VLHRQAIAAIPSNLGDVAARRGPSVEKCDAAKIATAAAQSATLHHLKSRLRYRFAAPPE
jgi:hypothetical protein